MHKLHELKETLCRELEEYSNKGKLSAGDLEIVYKLSCIIKNLGKIIKMHEEGEYSEMSDYGYESRGGNRGGGNRGGGYSREYSMAQRRDSRGRYSNDGMMIRELRELMEDAPDERTRQEFQKFISKMESM